MKTNMENTVAFCILMENGKGILDKSPDYIMEKFNRLIVENFEIPGALLDFKNKRKLNEWSSTWGGK